MAKKCVLPQWTDTETAYIAGIVDGEGYIGVTKTLAQIQIKVHIANTHKEMMRWLAIKFGLSEESITLNRPSDGRQWFSISVYAERAYVVTLRLYPYLKVKHNQAVLLMNYHYWRKGLGERGRWKPFSKEEKKYMNAIVLASQAMNTKVRQS